MSKINKNSDEITMDQVSKMAEENYREKIFMAQLYEQIKKYITIDNLIREKSNKFREKINTLKELRQDSEDFIIKSLNEKHEDIIDLGKNELGENQGKLLKNVSSRKGTLKAELIKEALKEGLIQEKIISDEKECEIIVDSFLQRMDKKRPIKSKEYIKRTFPKKPRKNIQKKNQSNQPNQLTIESDVDIPIKR